MTDQLEAARRELRAALAVARSSLTRVRDTALGVSAVERLDPVDEANDDDA